MIDLSAIPPEILAAIAIVLVAVSVAVVVVLRRRRRRLTDRGVPPSLEEGVEAAPAPASAPSVPAPPAAAPQPPYERLRRGLRKTRQSFLATLAPVLGQNRVDAQTLEDIETALLGADVGMGMTERLVTGLRGGHGGNGESIREHLAQQMVAILDSAAQATAAPHAKPWVIVVVGVNGVGKTTSIGKLATRYAASGKSVLLVAADTFRAAAIDQLVVWAERAHADVVRSQPGSDPGAVVHDGAHAAIARGIDVVIVDTAGRLHTKSNLMEELRKVRRVIERALPGAPHETLLVLDAVTGQNGVAQARAFTEAVGVTGVILSKLDGTAKGGVVLAIAGELGVPIRYVGVGEGVDDLREFDSRQFISALLAPETQDSLDT